MGRSPRPPRASRSGEAAALNPGLSALRGGSFLQRPLVCRALSKSRRFPLSPAQSWLRLGAVTRPPTQGQPVRVAWLCWVSVVVGDPLASSGEVAGPSGLSTRGPFWHWAEWESGRGSPRCFSWVPGLWAGAGPVCCGRSPCPHAGTIWRSHRGHSSPATLRALLLSRPVLGEGC